VNPAGFAVIRFSNSEPGHIAVDYVDLNHKIMHAKMLRDDLLRSGDNFVEQLRTRKQVQFIMTYTMVMKNNGHNNVPSSSTSEDEDDVPNHNLKFAPKRDLLMNFCNREWQENETLEMGRTYERWWNLKSNKRIRRS